MESLILPYCWICTSPSSLHEHHIVPRAYGGSDGPTVTLCATCHNGIHHVADGREEMTPDHWVKPDVIERATRLINTIISSRVIASKSDNKRSTTILILSAEETATLDRVKVMLGQNSRVSALKTLINQYDQRKVNR